MNKPIVRKYIRRQNIEPLLSFAGQYDAVVVIPVLADELIYATLDSLNVACLALEKSCSVAVLVVVNHAESETLLNKKVNNAIYNTLRQQMAAYQFDLYVLPLFDLPVKKSGVGIARKVGMDQAVWQFFNQNKQGIIVSLDADTLVSRSYFKVLFSHFERHPDTNAVIFHFEHTRASNHLQQHAMVLYELYLRYYVEALRYIRFPFAYYTIGSAFAVSSNAYVAAGGMNKNKAGEDFYFLHKVFPMGEIYDLTDAEVYPSSRISQKTPFGTGRALAELMHRQGKMEVYDFNNFMELAYFFEQIHHFYQNKIIAQNVSQLPLLLQEYLDEIQFENIVAKLKQNTATLQHFRKAFFIWFDGFKVVKYLNFAAARNGKVDIMQAIRTMTAKTGLPYADAPSETLNLWRKYHKKNKNTSWR